MKKMREWVRVGLIIVFALLLISVCYIIKNPQGIRYTKSVNTDKKITVLLKSKNQIHWNDIYMTSDSDILAKSTNEDTYGSLGNNIRASADLDFSKGDYYRIKSNSKIQIKCSEEMDYSNSYMGDFVIYHDRDGYVITNVIYVEDYLKYVVASEMSDEFEIEALKAQAVAARTYTYRCLDKLAYEEYGANLDDTTNYQSYNLKGRTDKIDKAVKATEGEVISSKGKLIYCYYFSTSNGFTEDLSVWNQKSPSYIKANTSLINFLNYDLTDESEFLSFLRECPDSYDKESPYYRWKATVKLNKMVSDYGSLKSIKVAKRDKYGYIRSLIFSYSCEDLVVTNEKTIRSMMGVGLTSITLFDGRVLENTKIFPSASFVVSGIDEENGILTIEGAGFGHGIGMSQYGANGMAKANMSYKQILRYFYNNVDISQ